MSLKSKTSHSTTSQISPKKKSPFKKAKTFKSSDYFKIQKGTPIISPIYYEGYAFGLRIKDMDKGFMVFCKTREDCVKVAEYYNMSLNPGNITQVILSDIYEPITTYSELPGDSDEPEASSMDNDREYSPDYEKEAA